MINSLLPNNKAHAILAYIGKIIKPIPVIDRVIEVDVAPLLTIVSTESNIVIEVLSILYFFWDLCFYLRNTLSFL